MRFSTIALAFAAGLSASPAFATNLVTNGDFTSLTNGVGQIIGSGYTAATDWYTTGYNFVFSSATDGGKGIYGNLSLWTAANGGANGWNGAAANGGNFLAMDGKFQTASVSQTISGLTVGQKYTLDFNYAFAQQYGFDGATKQNLTVSVGSASLTTPTFDLANHGFSGWNDGSLSFTATSSSEVLSFLAYGNLPVPPFALVSNVSLLATPGPEAGVGLLSFAALGGLVFLRRRSVRSKADAAI